MLRHNLLVANPLRKGYLTLRDPPFATRTRRALAFVIAIFPKYQIIYVLSVCAQQFALVRPLSKMCTLEIGDGMRSSAGVFENDSLRRKIVMSPDRTQTALDQYLKLHSM